ncbi:MAG: PIN domain-containing protein [Nocardioides sp.]
MGGASAWPPRAQEAEGAVTSGLCLDAGALIGVERGDRRVLRLLELAVMSGREVHVTAGVVAQVWRGGVRQARLARLLRSEDVRLVPLDATTARAVGELCGLTGASDVVDGHVAFHARLHRLAVVTSDPGDVSAFAGDLDLIVV